MRYLLASVLFSALALCGAPSAHALTVSPVKIEIAGDPGQTLVGEIELLNEQLVQKTLYPSYENFEPSGDTGSPRFIGGDEGLATWIKTEKEITLAPGEKKSIPFSITIPKESEPGGYFAALFWGEKDPSQQEGGEVSIGGRLGVLILLRVNGDIEEAGGIVDFAATEGRLYAQLPVHFLYRVSNAGGDRIVPLGDVRIKNTFRGTSAVLQANPKEGSILPQSARRFDLVWEDSEKSAAGFFAHARHQLNNFHFGWYTADLDLIWGSENQKHTATYHFFIVPWQLLICLCAILVGAYFGMRRYNTWIISRNNIPRQ